MSSQAVARAKRDLDEYTMRYPGRLLAAGVVGERWQRLYDTWIVARWDAGDPWVRAVWTMRPVVSPLEAGE